MSDPEFVHSPPSYESSLRNDQKISQSLQQDELKKAPVTDDEHADRKQTKEYLPFQHTVSAEIPVLPLRIQKRSPAPTYGGTRRPRPLPPCPTDAKMSSIHGKEIPHLKAIMDSKMRGECTEEDLPPAPPPFAPVGPSLNGPPYKGVGAAPLATSSLSDPFRSSFHSSYHRQGSHSSQLPYPMMEHCNEPPSRRSGYGALQGAAGEANAQGRTQGARLSFDPSVAYTHDHLLYGDAGGSRSVDAVSLYSHAVSSHVQHTPANSGTRYPLIRSANRSSLRPLSANSDFSAHSTGSLSRQSSPAVSTSPSISWHSLSHPPRR